MQKPSLRTLLFISCCAALTACGGGGGGGDPTAFNGNNGNGNGNGNGQVPTNLNPGLTGKLYFNAPKQYVELDLTGGVEEAIRNDSSGARASSDGQEFVITADSLTDFFNSDALNIFGRDGRTLVRFDVEGSLLGSPKLSPDKQLIAVKWWPPSEYSVGNGLAVFDRTGKLIQIYQEPTDWDHPFVTSWDWTPEGLLLFSFGDSILQADPRSANPHQVLKSFPNNEPDSLAVSPDGTHIAFTLKDDDKTHDHVFVMNRDGSGERQLTTSFFNERNPAWSPDGRYIAVRQGVVDQLPIPPIVTSPNSCPDLYILPMDAPLTDITADNPAPAIKIQKLENGKPRNVCAFSAPDWRNTATPTRVAGTRTTGGGLNSGLSGRLFFTNPEFLVMNLEDGVHQEIPVSDHSSEPFPSADGQEIVYTQSDADSKDFSNQQVTMQRLDGTRTGAFEHPDFLYEPKFSPDGSLLAAEWHSIDLGDAGGTPIVNVFDRFGNVKVRLKDFQSWAWLPNGSLALGRRTQLFLTDTNQMNPALVVTLSDPIDSLDIHPAGNKIALGMGGHAWTLNLDGSGLKQLTASTDGELKPIWSPDGHYLAVTLDIGCPEVYAVPADGERVFLNAPTIATSAWKVLMLNDDGEPRNTCSFSTIAWRL